MRQFRNASFEILLSNVRNGKKFLGRKSGQRNRRYIFFHSGVFLSTEAINSFQYYFNSPRNAYKRGANSRFMVEIYPYRKFILYEPL